MQRPTRAGEHCIWGPLRISGRPPPQETPRSRFPAPSLPVTRSPGPDATSGPGPARRFLGEEDQIFATAPASGRKEEEPLGAPISGQPRTAWARPATPALSSQETSKEQAARAWGACSSCPTPVPPSGPARVPSRPPLAGSPLPLPPPCPPHPLSPPSPSPSAGRGSRSPPCPSPFLRSGSSVQSPDPRLAPPRPRPQPRPRPPRFPLRPRASQPRYSLPQAPPLGPRKPLPAPNPAPPKFLGPPAALGTERREPPPGRVCMEVAEPARRGE